VRFGDHLRF